MLCVAALRFALPCVAGLCFALPRCALRCRAVLCVGVLCSDVVVLLRVFNVLNLVVLRGTFDLLASIVLSCPMLLCLILTNLNIVQ